MVDCVRGGVADGFALHWALVQRGDAAVHLFKLGSVWDEPRSQRLIPWARTVVRLVPRLIYVVARSGAGVLGSGWTNFDGSRETAPRVLSGPTVDRHGSLSPSALYRIRATIRTIWLIPIEILVGGGASAVLSGCWPGASGCPKDPCAGFSPALDLRALCLRLILPATLNPRAVKKWPLAGRLRHEVMQGQD